MRLPNRQRFSASAADVIAGNDDLLTEILRWLPARSLLRFKSVSKHWLQLISSPDIYRLLNPNPTTVSALFLSNPSSSPIPDLLPLDGNPPTAFPNLLPSISILQSCNGLLCCESWKKNEKNNPDYYICNPTTRQFTILPELPGPAVGVILAFDPCESLDYQAICVRWISCSPVFYRIEIYSSRTRSWRPAIDDPFTTTGYINFREGVFWNGAVHWITESTTVFSFDVNQERVLGEMAMPQIKDWNKRSIRYFGASRDHLHVILISGACAPQFLVYEMKRDYSGWFVKYKVDLRALKTLFSDMGGSNFDISKLRYRRLAILCLARGEIDDESFLVMRTPHEAVRYSFKDKTSKKLCDFTAGHDKYIASQYIETLVRV
ncbi:hypothetical protein L1049_019825 [Liquidambar formosana]|uniref:F-box domain-containing protein n=1 Tax=Liquidambar formosana TaxID=63359 RepID=A0AAP0SC76_LIQFO